jgi:methionine-rich copper-binding protein CopC
MKTRPLSLSDWIRQLALDNRAAVWLALVGLAVILSPAHAQTVPTIISTVPAYMTMGVAPNAPVVITFSKAMNTNVTVGQFFSIIAPTNPLPVSAAWNSNHTQLTCTPSPSFPASTFISWSVIGADTIGNPLVGQTSGIFMTGTGGPWVVSVTPENGSTNIPPTTPAVFTFSAAMNTNATWAQFHTISAPTVPLPTTATWSADKTRLTCTPNPPFPVSQTILWTVMGEDLATNTMQGTSGMFMTPASAPTLVSANPTNQATNVSPNAPVVFTFSTAMDTNLTTAQFHDSTAPSTPLPFAAAWSLDLTTLTCAPSPSFPTNRTILWGLTGENLMGQALGGSTNGSFATASSNAPAPVSFGLISRGEAVEQTDTNLFEVVGPELSRWPAVL